MSMDCTFQVGDRVVCVDAQQPPDWHGHNPLTEFELYTIAHISVSSGTGLSGPHQEGGVCLHLKEIPGWRFRTPRFRPVKTMEFWIGEKQSLKVPA